MILFDLPEMLCDKLFGECHSICDGTFLWRMLICLIVYGVEAVLFLWFLWKLGKVLNII